MPYRAVGVTTAVPNINAEMHRFEQEVRFSELVRPSLLGFMCVNLTQNRLAGINITDDTRYDPYIGADYDGFRIAASERSIMPEGATRFRADTSRAFLLERFRCGEMWRFLDYRRISAAGAPRWVNLFIKLMRHPISGDIYGFGYLRDNETRRGWELALGIPLTRDSALMLYSPESMDALSRHILSVCPPESLVAVSVVELIGLGKLRSERGISEANDALFTFGRLCRIVVAGDTVVGQPDENHVAFLRVDAGSAEGHRERVTKTVQLLKELMAQAHPEANIGLISGFAVDQAGSASYDLLLRKATIACRSASQMLGGSTVAYADTGIQEPGEDNAFDLMKRCQSLELRCQQLANMLSVSEYDALTGLLGRHAFYRHVRELLDAEPDKPRVIIRFDVNRFKVFNDVRGTAAGDKMLRAIASSLREQAGCASLFARLESDHFVILANDEPSQLKRSLKHLSKWIAAASPDFKLSFTVGVYRVTDPHVDVSLMCDRALLALRACKSGFETRVAYYDETLRGRLLEEQLLMDDMEDALRVGQFVVYFQPQINYEDGSVIGAESLVRWQHPERGLLSPAEFIPLFEKNGLITKLDEYVWDLTCRHLKDFRTRYPSAEGMSISVNVSRLDIFDMALCDTLLDTVKRYDLPPSALRLEITESAYIENPQQLIDTANALHTAGFIVEMDDFGSGFSSLNTLKDVNVDTLKLDMKFLENCKNSERGGNILSSIIRMAHWLKLPVIAEGVESKEQADYLQSLSCVYMQGYYFAKPMPASEFEKLLEKRRLGRPDRYESVNVEGIAAFWDASAQTALLFNSYVGGAAILEYENGDASIVRANDRFYTELETTREAYFKRHLHLHDRLDRQNILTYVTMLEKAVTTGDEAECETRRLPADKDGRIVWTHNRVRPLARNGEIWLLYLAIENITARKQLEAESNAEAERSQLMMKTTGTCFLDYDYQSDTLCFQAYKPGEGALRYTIPQCGAALTQNDMLDEQSLLTLSDLYYSTTGDANGEVELRADLWGTGMRWYRMRYVRLTGADGKPERLIGQVDDIQDMKERRALASAVERRLNSKSYALSFNDLVVNQIFDLFYETADVMGAIETTLALLADAFGIDRAYIFEDDPGHASASNTFEYCAPDVPPQKEGLQNVPYATMGGREDYLAHFDGNGAFYCTDLSSMPGGAQDILRQQGIRSMLQYALWDGGVFSGFIGFDECTQSKNWTDEQIGTLMFVSRIIGAFLLKLRKSDSAAFSADFRAALDDNASFIYIIDPDSYEIIYNNKAIYDVYGEDYIGKLCYREFVGRDAPCEHCPLHRLSDPNDPHIAEVTRADGMIVLTNASPLRWNGRDMVMLSCIDITESKRAEKALMTEKQKTELALKATRLSLWTYDLREDAFHVVSSGTGTFESGSVVAGAYKALIGKGLLLPESEKDYIALHERVQRGEPTASCVIHYDPAKSRVEWMQISYTTLFDPSGKPISAIATGQDVTAQKRSEERYRQETEYRRALGSEYVLTMRLNITKDALEDVQCTLKDVNCPAIGTKQDKLIRFFTSKIVSDEDKARFKSLLSYERLLRAYESGATDQTLSYRVAAPDGDYNFLRLDLWLAKRPADGDIVAFVAIRDQTMDTLVQRIFGRLIDKSYDFIAYIDVDTGKYRRFSIVDGTVSLSRQSMDYELTMRNASGAIRSANRKSAPTELSIASIVKALETDSEYVRVYRIAKGDGERVKRLVYRRLNEDGMQILLTQKDVTGLLSVD